MLDNSIIKCHEVVFSYRNKQVLKGVSCELTFGVIGILGPNGAGKTTLFNLLTTLREPDSGRIEVLGHDVSTRDGRVKARSALGFLPQRFTLMGSATSLANVEYAAWANGVPAGESRAAALAALEIVNLAEHGATPARKLSGGMRQRLGIACAIAHGPKVLILDEPTVGLDPMQRIDLRTHLSQIAESTCVIISTHIVDDIERIAQRALVLRDGVFVFDGPVGELAALAPAELPGISQLEAGYMGLMRG